MLVNVGLLTAKTHIFTAFYFQSTDNLDYRTLNKGLYELHVNTDNLFWDMREWNYIMREQGVMVETVQHQLYGHLQFMTASKRVKYTTHERGISRSDFASE